MRKENESHWEAISWSPSTGFWLVLVVEEATGYGLCTNLF